MKSFAQVLGTVLKEQRKKEEELLGSIYDDARQAAEAWAAVNFLGHDLVFQHFAQDGAVFYIPSLNRYVVCRLGDEFESEDPTILYWRDFWKKDSEWRTELLDVLLHDDPRESEAERTYCPFQSEMRCNQCALWDESAEACAILVIAQALGECDF